MATKALSIELLLESKAFTAQMQKVNDSFKNTNKNLQAFGANLQKVGASMAAVGVSITAAFGVAVKSLANAADEADDTAKRTGLTVEAVQELAYAAKLCGTDLGTMEIALRTVQKNMAGTGQESATFKAALEGLGISLKDLQSRSPQEQFDTISQAIARVVDPSQRAGLAMAVFGRSGTALLPMLAEGADGMARLKQEAHQFGYVMDQETAKAGSDFNDNLDRLKGAVGGLAAQIVAGMLPALNTFVRAMAEIVAGIKDWVSQHPALVKTLAWVAAGVGGILTVFGSLVAACGTFIALAPAIGAAFTVATGPIGVTVRAIAGLVAGIVALYKNWDTVSHYLMQSWRVLTALVLQAVEMQLKALSKLVGWVPKVGSAVKSALSQVQQLQQDTWQAVGDNQLEYEKKKNEKVVEETQKTAHKVHSIYAEQASITAQTVEQQVQQSALKIGHVFGQDLTVSLQDAFTSNSPLEFVSFSNPQNSLNSLFTNLTQTVENSKNFVKNFWDYVYEVSNTQTLNISNKIQTVYDDLTQNLSSCFQNLFAQIGNGWEGVKDIAIGFAKSMYNSLTQILADIAAEQIKNIIAVSIANRTAAKANIAASAGEAGAKAAAGSAGWALFGAVAIGAAVLAAVLAFADGFATGGIVGGNSFTGDKVLTRVNSGEMILNEAQQARLFAIADGRESAENGGVVTINQNITVQNGNDIEAITQAIKRGSMEALEMANVVCKAGKKQNKYVG